MVWLASASDFGKTNTFLTRVQTFEEQSSLPNEWFCWRSRNPCGAKEGLACGTKRQLPWKRAGAAMPA